MNTLTWISLVAGFILVPAYVWYCIANLRGYEDDGAAVVAAILISIANMCFFSSLYGQTMSFWQGSCTLVVPLVVLVLIALACGGDTGGSDDGPQY